MISEFTFCSFTYNQERYIIQQLESIRYQIEKYGSGISCRYLLADDCSSDDTISIVKDWIKNNEGLFSDVEILEAEINRGIVRNYENALRHIHTEHFKILAGDDFYYRNNIFDIYGDSNFVISPLIFFTDDGNVVRGSNRMVRRLLTCGEDSERIKKCILRLFKYTGGLPAPGIFFSNDLVDKGLFNALAPFTWIEDVPEWHYLLQKAETQVNVISKPLVAYRADIGISQRPKHPGFLRDLELLNERIHTKKGSQNKFLNPYYYMRVFEFIAADFKKYANSRIRTEIRNLQEAETQSLSDCYIKDIMKKAGS